MLATILFFNPLQEFLRIKIMLKKLSTEQLMNCFPENLLFYKDSGSWNICEDDISINELYHQKLNEDFRDFLIRALSDIRKKEYNESIEIDICLSVSDASNCC